MSKAKKRKIYPITIFMIFMLLVFTFIATYFYYQIIYQNKLKEVYDKGENVQAVIVSIVYPNKTANPLSLRYEYIDEDGFKYTGSCYSLYDYEEAKSYMGKEVTIKIYDQLSYCGNERPSAMQVAIAAVLFTVLDVALATVLILSLKKTHKRGQGV